MEKIGTDMAASSNSSAYELDSNGQTLQQKIAKGNLQEVIDLLNQEARAGPCSRDAAPTSPPSRWTPTR